MKSLGHFILRVSSYEIQWLYQVQVKYPCQGGLEQVQQFFKKEMEGVKGSWRELEGVKC